MVPSVNPVQSPTPLFKDPSFVNATDNITVVFKFKTPNPEYIMETLHTVNPTMCIENPEAVKKWGNLNDWHHAIGTGTFILKDFVPARFGDHGQEIPIIGGMTNVTRRIKLPYVDSVKYLIISDEEAARGSDALR